MFQVLVLQYDSSWLWFLMIDVNILQFLYTESKRQKMKVLLILAVTVAAVECFQICSPEFCKLLPNCEPKCGPGESLIKNGNCDCCGYCVLMEVVGEKCNARYLPSIFPNKKYLMCQTGYRCDPRTRRCVKKDRQ
ncbi:hypothetical protein CDAR_48152 [Caerostris darwini]|uniref:Uncharacterized protein n=1 Tax=Caerostris darwini TaxID=1538125 RepID=A0AAV4W3R9_9ARAC|nr:hypothetical protein CDAR_48152 [Caerostris darwini]